MKHFLAGYIPNCTPWMQAADAWGFKHLKELVCQMKITMFAGTLPDRYQLAKIWVTAIKQTWTKAYIFKALRMVGMLPFTRSAHLVGNAPDIEIGDCLQEDERIRMRENNRKRRNEVQQEYLQVCVACMCVLQI